MSGASGMVKSGQHWESEVDGISHPSFGTLNSTGSFDADTTSFKTQGTEPTSWNGNRAKHDLGVETRHDYMDQRMQRAESTSLSREKHRGQSRETKGRYCQVRGVQAGPSWIEMEEAPSRQSTTPGYALRERWHGIRAALREERYGICRATYMRGAVLELRPGQTVRAADKNKGNLGETAVNSKTVAFIYLANRVIYVDKPSGPCSAVQARFGCTAYRRDKVLASAQCHACPHVDFRLYAARATQDFQQIHRNALVDPRRLGEWSQTRPCAMGCMTGNGGSDVIYIGFQGSEVPLYCNCDSCMYIRVRIKM
ncbi:hypothetical protein OE88DRAFT_1644092 [Heliocybe sulcata]|uniref:Uncharacterized protein n=1 Tax=Heliocybe sulcata TaxID=5364 RepID=A0A5C3N6D3_9AGAM|nr:hypothetical protein OE88DRAFT_1644092 [Heliocybe sulcata]